MDQNERVHFLIEGMHCDACVRRVKKALEKVPGLTVQGVSVGSADVVGDSSVLEQAKSALDQVGFTAHL